MVEDASRTTRPLAMQGPSLRRMNLGCHVYNSQNANKKAALRPLPCVARRSLSIRPFVIAVGTVARRAGGGGSRSGDDARCNAGRIGPVIGARPIAAIVVAVVVPTRRAHAVSAAQIVRVGIVEPDHAGLLGGFLR